MPKTYTGTLRNVYRLPRRFIVAHGMRIEFINGVAKGIPEYQANLLLKNNVLISMVEESGNSFNAEILPMPVPEPEVLHAEAPDEEEPVVETTYFDESETPNEHAGEVEPEVWQNVIPDEELPETQEPQEFISLPDLPELSPQVEEVLEAPVSVQTTMGDVTREDMEKLYADLKTWSAVASHFEVSTTVLKRYRDSLGL
jgi:hypothetical protein